MDRKWRSERGHETNILPDQIRFTKFRSVEIQRHFEEDCQKDLQIYTDYVSKY